MPPQLNLSGLELPPRARRILHTCGETIAPVGTTSACAENTAAPHSALTHPWNYLRVRGEYVTHAPITPTIKELPPRARRIPLSKTCSILMMGTTSACAENTSSSKHAHQGKRNYLRVRGEYPNHRDHQTTFPELPPRARRIPVRKWFDKHPDGTTSACAENTFIGVKG